MEEYYYDVLQNMCVSVQQTKDLPSTKLIMSCNKIFGDCRPRNDNRTSTTFLTTKSNHRHLTTLTNQFHHFATASLKTSHMIRGKRRRLSMGKPTCRLIAGLWNSELRRRVRT